jgi:hypothetical protein
MKVLMIRLLGLIDYRLGILMCYVLGERMTL